MTIKNITESDRVTIVGNSYRISPDPVGCKGGLVGFALDGRPIIDFFNPKDGKVHVAAFLKEDIEIG